MVRSIVLGFLLWFLIICMSYACGLGVTSFVYRYYGLEGITYEQGKLLGSKVQYDLPFTACAPTHTSTHPCVVLFAKDFFALKLDYEDTKEKLKTCEESRK